MCHGFTMKTHDTRLCHGFPYGSSEHVTHIYCKPKTVFNPPYISVVIRATAATLPVDIYNTKMSCFMQ